MLSAEDMELYSWRALRAGERQSCTLLWMLLVTALGSKQVTLGRGRTQTLATELALQRLKGCVFPLSNVT
jgi:hypothetical protein